MPQSSSSQLLPGVTSLFPGKPNSCFAPHSPATNVIPLVSFKGALSSSEKCEHPDFLISQPEQLSRKAARASLLLSATFAPNPGQGQHPGARFQLFGGRKRELKGQRAPPRRSPPSPFVWQAARRGLCLPAYLYSTRSLSSVRVSTSPLRCSNPSKGPKSRLKTGAGCPV